MSIRKLKSWTEIGQEVQRLRSDGKKIVFTNGCFDLLHVGHIRLLRSARQLGDCLVVGLNADVSVRALKGKSRPLQRELERAEILGALESVSYVVLFDQETPLELIKWVQPDVLAKGGDWALSDIVGRREIEERGGRVVPIRFETGFSTSQLIERVQKLFC